MSGNVLNIELGSNQVTIRFNTNYNTARIFVHFGTDWGEGEEGEEGFLAYSPTYIDYSHSSSQYYIIGKNYGYLSAGVLTFTNLTPSTTYTIYMTTNDTNRTVILNKSFTNKATPIINTQPTAQITYMDPLTNVSLTGGVATVYGTFISNSTQITNSNKLGSVLIYYSFTPSDVNYNTVQGSTNVTIIPKVGVCIDSNSVPRLYYNNGGVIVEDTTSVYLDNLKYYVNGSLATGFYKQVNQSTSLYYVNGSLANGQYKVDSSGNITTVPYLYTNGVVDTTSVYVYGPNNEYYINGQLITINTLKNLSVSSDLDSKYNNIVITDKGTQFTVNCPTLTAGNLGGLTYDYTVDISSIQSNKNFIIFIDDKDVLIGDSIYKSNPPVYPTIGSITKKTATGYVSFNNPISISINSTITYYFNLTFGSMTLVSTSPPNIPCFNENTKILCLNEKSQEEYVLIQNLKKGDLVKTYLHGYKKIVLIGNNTLINNPNWWTKCMYRMKKEKGLNEDALSEDLIVTGGHSILVDELNDIDKTNQKLVDRKAKVDGKLLLWAGQSSRFEKLNDKNKYTYYHLVLEDEKTDDNRRYGIYANGILAETTVKKDFVKNLNELNELN